MYDLAVLSARKQKEARRVTYSLKTYSGRERNQHLKIINATE